MSGPHDPYTLLEDDDTTVGASFWHIRNDERWVIARLLNFGLDHKQVKFNSELRKAGMKLRDQFKQGLK